MDEKGLEGGWIDLTLKNCFKKVFSNIIFFQKWAAENLLCMC